MRTLKASLSKPDLKQWRDDLAQAPLAEHFKFLDALDTESLRSKCGEEELKQLDFQLLPLLAAAARDSKDTPPEFKALSNDKDTVAAADAVYAGDQTALEAERAEKLVAFINSLEQGVREEIRERSQAVINGISADVQAMWQVLHPDNAIDGVRLYVPDDADKAIDIGLTFHGVEQESPRLTLSEGFRNSLGLCIFLAMAKRDAHNGRPLFLDDVVVSLDRNHRGMIQELLVKEFAGRQVLLFTHDRDWYAEMRQQLDSKQWTFNALMPYENPEIGIRWSHTTSTFGDARAQLEIRPDSSGNDARKIMDVELALIAEKLELRLPFRRADKNDKRMAHDFLERLVADGKKSFKKKGDGGYLEWNGPFDPAEFDAAKLTRRMKKGLSAW